MGHFQLPENTFLSFLDDFFGPLELIDNTSDTTNTKELI